MDTKINQYSAADLAIFKAVVEKELAKAETRFAYLETQLKEGIENKDDQGEFMDESSDSNDVELLQILATRQVENIGDLKNALKRIDNKTYGVCVITGQLIDKQRLLVVPTTLKSIKARTAGK